MTKNEEVLIELLTNRAVAKNYTFRWVNRRAGLPSLKNDITSALFRANYVSDFVNENGEREIILSEMGKIIVDRIDT
jgi:hypothetical protein